MKKSPSTKETEDAAASTGFPCPLVDGLTLPEDVRTLLRPDELARDSRGHAHRLPRFFFEIASWQLAKETLLTPHFRLSELLVVDCRETPRLLREFPHYVPCTVALLARYLEGLRERAGNVPVFIAANGGYRSPSHHLDSGTPDADTCLGPHQWAVAADIFRVGDTLLNTQATIEKYAALARDLGPGVNVLPYGHGSDQTDDHLHVDLGYSRFVPVGFDEGDTSAPSFG
jgi:hypothetical protein